MSAKRDKPMAPTGPGALARRALAARLAVAGAAAAGALALAYFLPPGFGAWRVEERVVLPFEGHHRPATAVALSPDGGWLASAGRDGGVRLWKPGEDRLVHVLELPGTATALAFSPAGAHLAAGSTAGGLRVWSTEDGILLAAVEDPPGEVTALAFATEETLAVASADSRGNGQLALYDAARGERLRTLTMEVTAAQAPTALAASPAGGILAAGVGSTVLVWDLGTDDPPRNLPLPAAGAAAVTALAFGWASDPAGDSAGEGLAAAAGNATHRFRLAAETLAGPKLEGEPEGEAVAALAFAAGPAGPQLLAADLGGTLRRFGEDGPERLGRLEGTLTHLALSASGAVAGAGADGALRFLAPGGDAPPLLLGAGPVALAASEDGRLLAASHGAGVRGTGVVRVHDAATGALVASHAEEGFTATCLAFAGGGAWLGAWKLREAPRWRRWRDAGAPPRGDSAEAPPDAPQECPPAHGRRFTVTVLRQVRDRETFLQDTRSDLLIPLSTAYRRTVDLPRRSLTDRLLARFPFAAARETGEIVFASCRPTYPLAALMAGAVLLALLPGTLIRAAKRRSAKRATRRGGRPP